MNLVSVAKDVDMDIYFDAVLNHKAGADGTEECRAIMCDWNGCPLRFSELMLDRNRTIGDVVEIKAWFDFNFPGRNWTYSNMRWHWYHFTGTDWVYRSCVVLT